MPEVNAVNTEQIERELAAPATSPGAGVTAEQMASDRMRGLINELNTGGRQQLTEARDKIDDLMHAIDRRGAALLAEVTEYAGFIQQAVEMKSILMEPVGRLATSIGGSLSPAPGPTITQQTDRAA